MLSDATPICDRAGNCLALEGDETMRIRTAEGTLLANGYLRVVVGGRGAYIELAPAQMVMANLTIPHEQEWRVGNSHAFYLEHRSRDAAFVKVYEQRRTVTYADYRIGLFYIAPADVLVGDDAEIPLTSA